MSELSLSPPPPVVGAGQRSDWWVWRQLWPFLKPYSWVLAAALAVMPVNVLAGLLQPYLMKQAIDAAVLTQDRQKLMHIALLFLLCLVVKLSAGFAQSYWMQWTGLRSVAALRRAGFRHLQRLRIAYFDQIPSGSLVTRLTNDIDNINELFASGAIFAVADLLTLAGIVAFMLSIDWRLSLVTFACLPPLLWLLSRIRQRAREAFRSIRQRLAELNTIMAEQVQGIAVVQAFGREQQCAQEYAAINGAYRDANLRAIRYDALIYSVVESVSAATLVLILTYASFRLQAFQGNAAPALAYIGTVVAFYEYIQRFFEPIRELSQRYTVIQSSITSAERVVDLLHVREVDAPTLSSSASSGGASDEEAAIRFVNVNFSYKTAYPTLQEVSFSLRRGEKLALVGATGAGKTTIASLLLRLYEIDDGAIVVDGRDVRDYPITELRRKFAIVPQDLFLVAGTVWENVTLGLQQVQESEVRAALVRVGALEVIERRAGGLHTPLSERGQNFSAGERQLLALARALILDRPYFILDEATSHVDQETERRLHAAMQEVLKGRTAIIIAHRLATIRDADQILVLQHGRVVEQGTHAALLAQEQGRFAQLHRLAAAEQKNSSNSIQLSKKFNVA